MPSRRSPALRSWRSSRSGSERSRSAGSGAPRRRARWPAPHFVDETTASGIDHTYDGDFRFAVGGGVAVFDCDDDGKPELYLAGGERAAALLRNESPTGGALAFAPVDDPAATSTGVTGAYPLDVDGDGRVDLAVLRAGESVAAARAWRLPLRAGERGLVVRRRRGHGDRVQRHLGGVGDAPDAGARERTSRSARTASRPPRAARTTCSGPRLGRAGYAAPLELTPGFCALSMLFSDWDRSGRRDLRVSNDREFYQAAEGQEQLWRMAADGPPRLYTDADGWVRLQIEGMGIASHDLTADGYPEVYLTSQGPNRLQTLSPAPPGRRTATSGSSAGSGPRRRSPAATRCRRPPGTRSSRTSTTTGSSTCSCPRATSTSNLTLPWRTRATC